VCKAPTGNWQLPDNSDFIFLLPSSSLTRQQHFTLATLLAVLLLKFRGLPCCEGKGHLFADSVGFGAFWSDHDPDADLSLNK
jgi:hypothetical protein